MYRLERCKKVAIVKIVKVRRIKDKRTGRVKGYFVRIPTEVAMNMELEGKEKAEVYADYKNGLITYKPF